MARAFRLIDVIAGVGVVALVLALVIVPMRRARDQARATQCLSNMRQCALALIQHQITRGTFPPSEAVGDGVGPGLSGWAMPPPYMDSYDFPEYNPLANPGSVQNSTIVGMKLSAWLCPANPNRAPIPASQIRTVDDRTMPGSSSFAIGHYGVNWGGDRLGVEGDFTATNGSCRGVMMAVPGRNERGPNRLIRPEDITDGIAETVLVAERRGGQGWAVGGWAGSEFDAGGSPSYQGADRRAEMGSAGSYHEGGRVVVGFCDGRCRLVSPGIDRRLWYALLTRDGAEVVPGLDDSKR